MNNSSYKFTLDIHSTQSQISIPVKFGDTARELNISLADGAVPYVIADGSRAVFSAKKADGKVILNDCVIEGNARILYHFTNQTANAQGISECEIKLYGKDDRLITSPHFIMVVDERVVYNEDVELSEDEKTTIDNLISAELERAEAEEARASAEAERTSAEDERVSAEDDRVSAEDERVSAEAERVEAEEARAVAEENREAFILDAIGSALDGKQDKLTIDDVPTYESPNLITSGAVYEHTQQFATEETLWEEIGCVYEDIHHEYATKDELADVYDILGQTIIVEEELESQYTARQTGDDNGILDGVMARMVRAYGSFEISEHDITPSTFEGIISTGNNILQLKANGWNNAWVQDGYCLHMSKDAVPTNTLVAYMVDPTGNLNLIDFLQDGETYRVIQEPYFSKPTDSGFLFLQVKCSRKDGYEHWLSTNMTDQVFTVDKSQYVGYEMYVYTKCDSGFQGRDYKFTVCLDRSGHKERALPYMDYGLRLSEPITLGGFDYIDFDTQTIVRRTEYATLEEPFMLGALEPYVADYECSLDGLRVAYYRLDGDWQEEYIDNLPTRYKAYEFGYEIPLPYGKCGYLKQAYYVKAGCIQ